jgi:hypothetical protein
MMTSQKLSAVLLGALLLSGCRQPKSEAIAVPPLPAPPVETSKIANPTCDRAREMNLDEVIKALDKVEAAVPEVPAEEAAYLEKESKLAFSSDDVPRMNAVVQRAYYRAWEVHRDFSLARKEVEQARQLPDAAPIKARIMAAAHAPYALSVARSSWDEPVTRWGGELPDIPI